MKYYIFPLIFLIIVLDLNAQSRHTISGYIQDAESGEKLIGANIYTKSDLEGTASNNYGFYSLTLEEGEYEIAFSYIGYETKIEKILLNGDIDLNISLNPSFNIEEVEITTATSQSVKSSQMSSIDISVNTIKKMPSLLGEVDVIKAIQLLPGVQSGTEGASGLYVRGGGPDQNLILLDGTPVYNASHLFGFFSVFNADAINNVTLIKGGFPARYGGRSSSVLDISLKEGNKKRFQGSGSIGLIASKLTLEGPIVKDKASFIISARRTYIDLIAQPIIRAIAGSDEYTRQGYYFYDLNAKVNYKVSDKDHIYLSVYSGDDKFYQNQEPYTYLYDGNKFTNETRSNLGWGNITSALRWNHQFNSKLFSNTTLTYSNYDYEVRNYVESIVNTADGGVTNEINSLNFLSGIEDFAGKIDFDYLPMADHYLRFGANYTHHTFKPGASVYKIKNENTGDIDTTLGEDFVRASEFYLYAEDDYKITDRFKANIGLHYSGFLVNQKYYHSLQPRISTRYLLADSWSVKSSYAMMQQYIHLLTNNNIGLPTDLWVSATDNVRPQQSHQVATGISKSIGQMYLFSVEGYYKLMNNLIEYRDGASFMGSSTGWEDKVESGKGWSYGGELFIEKKIGKLTGWIGYTLSWTNRQFENLNQGKVFPYKYDRRHDVAIVMTFPLDDKWNFSTSWVYGTGNAHTLPTERYFGSSPNNYDFYYPGRDNYDNSNIPFTAELEHVDGRNSIRAADYHRLDVSFQKTKEKRWGEATWTLGVYNAYSRKNPFFYYIGRDSLGNRALRRVSIFPFIPSVNYSFKF